MVIFLKEDKRNKLLDRLDALKLFPNNNEVRKLRSRTIRALERLEIPKEPKIPKIKDTKKRSSSLKKYHRYIRMIRDNFPDLEYSDIRKQFAKRRRGDSVSIPDAVWQNPSP